MNHRCSLISIFAFILPALLFSVGCNTVPAKSTIPVLGIPPPASYFEDGDNYLKAADYDHAITALSKSIQLKPDFGRAYYERGIAYGQNGDYDRALSDFNKAIQLGDTSLGMYVEPGGLAILYGDYKSTLASAYYNRGVIYGKKENFAQAIADYTKAIELNPNNPSPFTNRGIAHRQLGNYELARADLDVAIKMNPISMNYYEHGLVLSLTGDIDGAISDLSKAIELDPNYALAYGLRGGIYEAKAKGFLSVGDPSGNVKQLNDQAIADFQKVLVLSNDPDLRRSAETELKSLGK